MGIAKKVSGDPYFNNVVLLMNMDNPLFPDIKGHPMTVQSGITYNTSTPKWGVGAMACAAGNTGVITPAAADIQLGLNDFTMECWFNQAVATGGFSNYQQLVGQQQYGTGSNSQFAFHIQNGQLRGQITVGGTSPVNILSSVAHSLNVWHHAAFTRQGNTYTLWLDGVSVGTASNSSTVDTSTRNIVVGADSAGQGAFNGSIDDLRITIGVARYTSPFAVPAGPFPTSLTGTDGDPYFNSVSLLMHMNGPNASTIFYDVKGQTITRTGTPTISNAQSKFNGTSGLFNGSTDYLVTPSNAGYGFGTGDFTMECFAYVNTAKSGTAIMDMRASGGGSGQVKPTIQFSTNTFTYFTNGTARISTASTITTGVWYHIAVSRVAGTTYMFLDGVLQGTYVDANNYGTTGDMVIAGVGDSRGLSSGLFPGYLAELRITKGVGRYTSNFSVPTAAYPDKIPNS
jgi:hypothetical protein